MTSTILVNRSMGTGNTTVELFSAAMLFRVWRYRSCNENDLDSHFKWEKLLVGWWCGGGLSVQFQSLSLDFRFETIVLGLGLWCHTGAEESLIL